jgi:hypothetical protein
LDGGKKGNSWVVIICLIQKERGEGGWHRRRLYAVIAPISGPGDLEKLLTNSGREKWNKA